MADNSGMSKSAFTVLSLIPPMTQLNTPYPSTAYLTGFLRSQGIHAVQADIALGLVLRLFSPEGLDAIADEIEAQPEVTERVAAFMDRFDQYRATIGPTIRFLQGGDSTLAHRINTRNYLPEGERFDSLNSYVDEGGDSLAWAFGALGAQDRARHLATLYLNDLSDVVRDAIDERFEFVRYAESLASGQASFDPMELALEGDTTLVDDVLVSLALEACDAHQPDLVLLSVPFPGAMYAALRIGQAIKAEFPKAHVSLGGGYPNTELRELGEPRVFNYVDTITLDAGERPLLALIEHLQGKRGPQRLVRTFVRTAEGAVKYVNWAEPDVPFEDVGTPTWDGLPIHSYLSLLDMLNPMHRLWSDGRWNKLTVAHGCYWKKCSFCDVSLDYIGRYETATATELVNRIERIVEETGQTGFHFVDEAAPPKSLKALAHELLERQVSISWWGNIRFEKSFTPELCQLMAQSGCIAISGGLEVASDRLLKLMQKGVSVAQVARVTKAFSDAGVLVHAYLMYGFPTQTVQDTVDALEYVRQLFAEGCIQSGFFHRFACTVHSPVGKNPEAYGVTLLPLPEGKFAKNDVGFVDPTGVDHDALGKGLNKALYNYMHGVGLEQNVRSWFDMTVPKPTVPRDYIARALNGQESLSTLVKR
ncbi:radical SAM protein [Limnobacter humi]|uniref:Radical SAM protein n=2 Tax=Limnobacter humi TaxID=1778671 RepID=A0ABT1WJ09_9BURK|nr:radical SAM protein [Limnobacter humi]